MNTSSEATIRKFRLVQTEDIRLAERLVDFLQSACDYCHRQDDAWRRSGRGQL